MFHVRKTNKFSLVHVLQELTLSVDKILVSFIINGMNLIQKLKDSNTYPMLCLAKCSWSKAKANILT